MSRIAGRFTRVEPRRRAGRLVLGLLSDLPRMNCWSIAEWSGEATPDGMQHLLGRAKWDADQVRDDVRGYVVEHLHDDQAVLVVDETGDVKKGTGTVGVQRQYTGTAGRIENARGPSTTPAGCGLSRTRHGVGARGPKRSTAASCGTGPSPVGGAGARPVRRRAVHSGAVARPRGLSADEAFLTVVCAIRIATDAAIPVLAQYRGLLDTRVQTELVHAWSRFDTTRYAEEVIAHLNDDALYFPVSNAEEPHALMRLDVSSLAKSNSLRAASPVRGNPHRRRAVAVSRENRVGRLSS